MIAGPNIKSDKNGNQQRGAIPVLTGYHTVPKKMLNTLSANNLLTYQDRVIISSKIEDNNNEKTGKQDSSTQTESKPKDKKVMISKGLLDNVKSHQNMIYMIFASVGIPVFILFLFYFEVSTCYMTLFLKKVITDLNSH